MYQLASPVTPEWGKGEQDYAPKGVVRSSPEEDEYATTSPTIYETLVVLPPPEKEDLTTSTTKKGYYYIVVVRWKGIRDSPCKLVLTVLHLSRVAWCCEKSDTSTTEET